MLTSTSTHPAGESALSKLEWDLDGDGQYDDASGKTAKLTFDAPGAHTVGLSVTDQQGDTSVSGRTLQIVKQPDPPAAPIGPVAASLAPTATPAAAIAAAAVPAKPTAKPKAKRKPCKTRACRLKRALAVCQTRPRKAARTRCVAAARARHKAPRTKR